MKNKLLKRFLPILLSFALLFEATPVSAAYDEGQASETEEAGESDDALDAVLAAESDEESNAESTAGTGSESGAAGESQPESALPKAEISIDTESLDSYDWYDYTIDTVVLPYYQDEETYKNMAQSVVTAIKYAVSVKIDGSTTGAYKSYIKTKWQQGTTDMAEGAAPHAAGLYNLVVYLDEIGGVCTASDAVSIPVEIRKAEVTFGNVTNRIQCGRTVADLKEANKDIALYVNGASVDKEDYITGVIAVEVMDAWDSEHTPLADTAVLQNNQDYIIKLSVVFKDAQSFEVSEDTYNVSLYGTVNTRIDVNYTTPGKTIGKRYDGTLIDYDADIKPEYTAAVMYTDKDGMEKPLSGAEINGVWCDADRYEYKDAYFVPWNAGTYYYKLKYSDDSGTYADAYDYIEVEISSADLVIEPTIADNEVYEGVTVASILKGVEYNVYSVVNGVAGTEPMNIDEYFWGTVYQNDEMSVSGGSTRVETNNNMQYYVPKFAVQAQSVSTTTVDGVEQITVTWYNLSSNTAISKDGVYRIVFSGEKALYTESGSLDSSIGINVSQVNYNVDVTDDAIAKYAKELKVNQSTLVKVDVSAILQDGSGASITNPIIKTGGALYANKGEYKKAAVLRMQDNQDTGISSLDERLTYTWERASTFNIRNVTVQTESGTESKTFYVPSWGTGSYAEVDSASSPYNAGVYRLKVSFSDPSGEYSLATESHTNTDAYGEVIVDTQGNPTSVDETLAGYVYYVIKYQDAIMSLSGTPAIYADGINDVETFLYGLQRSSETDTETYVGRSIYPVTITGTDASGNAVYTKDEQNPLLTDFYISAYRESSYPYFYVEKQLKEGDTELADGTSYNAGDWVKCDSGHVFEQGRSYRLCVDDNSYYRYSPYCYNCGDKYDIINRLEKSNYYANESIAITIKNTSAVKVDINVDTAQLTDTVKVYDGKPIDLTALKQLVKVNSLAADGSVAADVTADVKDKLHYAFSYNSNDGEYAGYYVSEDKAVHGGSYWLTISLDTDDVYQASAKTLDIEFVINRRELKITPVLEDEIPAGIRGTYIGDYVIQHTIEGWEDAADGVTVNTEEDVISSITWRTYEKYDTGYNYVTSRLKSSDSYYVKAYRAYFKDSNDEFFKYDYYGDYYDEYALSYANDYTVTGGIAEFTPVRAAATTSVNSDYAREVRFTDSVKKEQDSFAHTITTNESVPYLYDFNLNGETVDGNYFIFDIYAPTEINSFANAVYENSVQNQNNGCYVIEKGTSYITLACLAAKDATYNFDIMWEPGYTENFVVDLSKSALQNDFEKAVAPKSLAFNGAVTKMAAGETQQLDVKITKSQMDDIILLGYKSSDEGILQVSESGFVTAVAKKGSATIEAYPCRLVDGVKTPITGKGVKTAKVKITVTDVAVPKISKLTAKDTFATIQYTRPANGYRREVYVLSGKRSAQEFEAEIAKVKNGDYSAFVYTDFISPETADIKGIITENVTGLVPGGNQYTVYLRNVSGIRTLDGDIQIAYSHVGAVKTFKTINAQASVIEAYFDASLKGQTAVLDDDNYYGDGYEHYIAPLSGKSAKVSLRARFYERYSQNYSDYYDYIWRTLPLASNMKKNYTLPKPVYYVTSNAGGAITEYQWSLLDEADKKSYFRCVDGNYYPVTAIATVDKSGKVTFKGKGLVYVMAFDSNYPALKSVIALHITASPNGVKGKSVKLQPGQSIWLSSYLEYTEGKTKVVNYNYDYADLSVSATSNEYFDIEKDGDDYYITALKYGKNAKLDLNVTDNVVKANGGKDAVVKLSVSAIEPVKNLKADSVFDDRFDVTFTYSQGGWHDFRIAITDARGNIVSDEIRTLYGTWDSKAKKYNYRSSYSYADGDHITRLSSYNVVVTAIYGNEKSKEAKMKVKTINIPASYNDLQPNAQNTGRTILVTTDSVQNFTQYLSSNPYLRSGNTYTLDFSEENAAARLRKTDTLIWKSSNTKVASIKANAGTYSATLKALREGVTTIEVRSKITKKVISRYDVYVCAVGDADEYFADNESYRYKNPVDLTDVNTKDTIEVTMNKPVSVMLNGYGEQWFVFTAPEDGSYYLSTSYYYSRVAYYVLDGSELSGANYTGNTLKKGQKLYAKVYNTTKYREQISISANK